MIDRATRIARALGGALSAAFIVSAGVLICRASAVDPLPFVVALYALECARDQYKRDD